MELQEALGERGAGGKKEKEKAGRKGRTEGGREGRETEREVGGTGRIIFLRYIHL